MSHGRHLLESTDCEVVRSQQRCLRTYLGTGQDRCSNGSHAETPAGARLLHLVRNPIRREVHTVVRHLHVELVPVAIQGSEPHTRGRAIIAFPRAESAGGSLVIPITDSNSSYVGRAAHRRRRGVRDEAHNNGRRQEGRRRVGATYPAGQRRRVDEPSAGDEEAEPPWVEADGEGNVADGGVGLVEEDGAAVRVVLTVAGYLEHEGAKIGGKVETQATWHTTRKACFLRLKNS